MGGWVDGWTLLSCLLSWELPARELATSTHAPLLIRVRMVREAGGIASLVALLGAGVGSEVAVGGIKYCGSAREPGWQRHH